MNEFSFGQIVTCLMSELQVKIKKIGQIGNKALFNQHFLNKY